jgi:hypothetical protein
MKRFARVRWLLGASGLLAFPVVAAQVGELMEFDRLTVTLVAAGLLLVCVILHYEAFALLTRLLAWIGGRRRPRMLVLILSLFVLHMIEVGVYAGAFHVLSRDPTFGSIAGGIPGDLFENVYFSLACYTTVGFGDLVPTGPLRLLAGSEALAGFVLITWSASFTFFEMERLWRG